MGGDRSLQNFYLILYLQIRWNISYFFSLQSDIVAIATVSQTFGVQPLSETSYFTEVASHRPTGFLRNSKH